MVITHLADHRRAAAVRPAQRPLQVQKPTKRIWRSRRLVSRLSASPWRAPLELFRPRGPGHGLCDWTTPGFQENAMTSPDKARRVEVKDADQVLAVAEVTALTVFLRSDAPGRHPADRC
jgi:hypothetical protein